MREPADTYRRRLYERAINQHGFVTTKDAEEADVPAVELRKIANRGGLEHVAYGVYRFPEIPRDGRDQFMEAVLRAGPGAYLTHDAVLAIHDLGQVNPRRIRVATPKRARPRTPDYVEIIRRDLPARQLTNVEGIPATTVAQALIDCQPLVMKERLIDAAREAARRGLLTRREADRVLQELEAA
ncbi:MAG: type IV toxin-antitoxin system AbiEi family antitoxin domain-containing protein [Acidimicrobiales bacterium]